MTSAARKWCSVANADKREEVGIFLPRVLSQRALRVLDAS